ncbi:hypothetical protein PLESTM_001630400 [Pleodorina starrii]|nr:hypothetical protein PLESTM_001630400 [Pleodorina starrii]
MLDTLTGARPKPQGSPAAARQAPTATGAARGPAPDSLPLHGVSACVPRAHSAGHARRWEDCTPAPRSQPATAHTASATPTGAFPWNQTPAAQRPGRPRRRRHPKRCPPSRYAPLPWPPPCRSVRFKRTNASLRKSALIQPPCQGTKGPSAGGPCPCRP